MEDLDPGVQEGTGEAGVATRPQEQRSSAVVDTHAQKRWFQQLFYRRAARRVGGASGTTNGPSADRRAKGGGVPPPQMYHIHLLGGCPRLGWWEAAADCQLFFYKRVHLSFRDPEHNSASKER